MSAAEHLQPRLFEPEEPKRVDVTRSLNRHDVYWHASEAERFPAHEDEWRHETPDAKPFSLMSGETGFDAGRPHPLGLHVGTAGAAAERGRDTPNRKYAHPFYVTGSYARPERLHNTGDLHTWKDENANGLDPEATRAVREGKNVLYENETEDAGNVSIRAPRQNLHTWAEHVRLYPHEHTYAERTAAKGGADLIYRRGPYAYRDGHLLPEMSEEHAPPGLMATREENGDFYPEWRTVPEPERAPEPVVTQPFLPGAAFWGRTK